MTSEQADRIEEKLDRIAEGLENLAGKKKKDDFDNAADEDSEIVNNDKEFSICKLANGKFTVVRNSIAIEFVIDSKGKGCRWLRKVPAGNCNARGHCQNWTMDWKRRCNTSRCVKIRHVPLAYDKQERKQRKKLKNMADIARLWDEDQSESQAAEKSQNWKTPLRQTEAALWNSHGRHGNERRASSPLCLRNKNRKGIADLSSLFQ